MLADAVVAVVMPFRDESAIIGGTLAHLARTCRTSGVSPDKIALVGVDNGSCDESAEEFLASSEQWGFGSAAVETSSGAVVSARARGFETALSQHAGVRLIISLDADTYPGPVWLREALTLWRGGADAISFIGTFPESFWSRVPKLTSRYAAELGTIFFDPITNSRNEHSQRGFHQSIFDEIGRTLVDQLFAVRPDVYERAGGHRIRLDEEGAEVLHEGGRLAYELSLVGVPVTTARIDRYTTSPRRLLGEADQLFSGESYNGKMIDYRAEAEGGLASLDARSKELDFSSLRRYVIRNYILFQLLCRPDLVHSLDASLPSTLRSRLIAGLVEARAEATDGFAAIATAAELDQEFGNAIDQNWRAAPEEGDQT